MSTLTPMAVPRARREGSQQDDQILTRLGKATSQLPDMPSVVEHSRRCTDVLDQLSAVTTAIDAAALLVPPDHLRSRVRAAVPCGDADENVTGLVTGIRRHVRSH
jgi:DNA-binding FrmR family transcriptional regulator